MAGLLSSTGQPATIRGLTVLSNDPAVNPAYAACAHVFVPYCTSDLYMGTTTNASAPLQFNGAAVFQGALLDVLTDRGIGAGDVTLVGSSAAAVGVIVHSQWVASLPQLAAHRAASRLRFILDSPVFVNMNNSMSVMFDTEGESVMSFLTRVYNLSSTDDATKYPCVVSEANAGRCDLDISTLLTGVSFPQDTPTLLVASVYDGYMLAKAKANLFPADVLALMAKAGDKEKEGEGKDVAAAAQEEDGDLTTAMLETITSVEKYGGVMQGTALRSASTR